MHDVKFGEYKVLENRRIFVGKSAIILSSSEYIVRMVDYPVKKRCALLISLSVWMSFAADPLPAAFAAPKIQANEVSDTHKAEYAYEIAQITSKFLSASNTSVEKFKMDFAYATAQVTAKTIPFLPDSQKSDFAYAMTQITSKVLNDPQLDMEKARLEFSYEVADITAKVITGAGRITPGKSALLAARNNRVEIKGMEKAAQPVSEKPTALLRNNADIETKIPRTAKKADTTKKPDYVAADISKETYAELVNDVMHVAERGTQPEKAVNIDGEVRVHYAANSGPGALDRNTSAFRFRLGMDTHLEGDWNAHAMLEAQKGIANYGSDFELDRLYVDGKLGLSKVQVGSFGYTMAEGNIYDSGFKGVKFDLGETVKYTLSFGQTDFYTKDTFVASVRYDDPDFNLETGVYTYRPIAGTTEQNTIWTIGGNYQFSNFGIGAMYLGSDLKDSNGDRNGYVLSLNYGDLKTYRPGTYQLFAKHYNQPLGTYIAHGMNGLGGSSMQGFKGNGVGISYTLAENLVAGMEYYHLTDKVSGERSRTWWNQLTYYFSE